MADDASSARQGSGRTEDDVHFARIASSPTGRSILLRQGEEDSDQVLIDLVNDQAEFARIVEPFRKELEFSGSDITWWPLGKERQIVLDPKRNFGQPSAARSGVPTSVLARSVKTNGSVKAVSHWFEVSEGEVRDAVEFEMRLAA